MLLIVEIVPYVAFLGAAALVGWVAFDVLREKRRKSSGVNTPEAKDSGRVLAGPATPMIDEPAQPAGAEDGVEEGEKTSVVDDAIEPAEELVLPSSQAVDVASEKEECENHAPESLPEPEEATATSEELAPEVEEDLDSDETVILVRRDPSVRVFDTAVAASERKVASE